MDRRPPLDSLTSLRFVTALHVFLFHLEASRILFAPDWLRPLAAIGYVGVNWFFVLSGFILAYAYAGRSFSLGDFWRARWARVYPAYFVSLLLAAPLFFHVVFLAPAPHGAGWIAAMREHAVSFALLALGLLQAWVPAAALSIIPVGWSRSAEEFFDLVFPLVLPWLAKLSGRALLAVVLALSLASLATVMAYLQLAPDGTVEAASDLNHLTWLNVLRFNPLVRLPEFLVGVCGALFFLRQAVDPRWAGPLVWGGLVALLAVVLRQDHIPYPLIHNGLLSLPFLAIIYGFALRPSWSIFLEWRGFRMLGEASYGFFLVHLPVIALVFRPDGAPRTHSIIEVLASIAITLAIAFALYGWVEQPARRRMAHLIAARRPAPAGMHGH